MDTPLNIGRPASESGSVPATRTAQPTPSVSAPSDASHREEAALALQATSLTREGRNTALEPELPH